MQYFGTDGIRGIVDSSLSASILKKIARAVILYLNKHKLNKKIIVGNDTRISSNYIFSVMCSVLLKYGVEVYNVGECSSPCLAYLTNKYSFSLGMMISASHNPAEFNGIKFFNIKGEKISQKTEREIEKLTQQKFTKKIAYTQIRNCFNLKDEYILFLRRILKNKLPCIFDCSCGGASKIVKKVIKNAKTIFDNPNGLNINNNCGCLHIEALKSICIKKQVIGFALDGDGDRLCVVTPTGKIIGGDEILFILSKYYLSNNDYLVGTIYSNTALENYCKLNNINFVRAGVGDKLVYQKMKKHSAVLGGENSGHIIVKRFLNTGDGVLTAILLLNIIQLTKCSIDELLKEYHPYYQAQTNVKIDNFKLTKKLKSLIYSLKNNDARIIVRKSGTEPVVRIMVEHKNCDLANKYLLLLKNLIIDNSYN